MLVEKAVDLIGNDKKTIIIYGDTGTGKTTACAMLPNVLILQTERNGLQSVAAVNPSADVVQIYNIKDLEDAVNALKEETFIAKKENRKPKWEWVVLDSLTDAQQLLKDHIAEKQTKASADGKLEKSRPTTMQEWGTIIDGTINMAKMFRDLEYNTVMICLHEAVQIEGSDEDSKILRHQLALYGKRTSAKVCSMANICALSYRSSKGKVYKFMLSGPENFILKSHVNLKKIESPKIVDWIARMNQTIDVNSFVGYETTQETVDKTVDKTKKEQI